MVKILFFARLREALGLANEELMLPPTVHSVAELKASLATRGGAWLNQFNGSVQIRAAVNQELVADSAIIKPGDEIAFFPPVTGG